MFFFSFCQGAHVASLHTHYVYICIITNNIALQKHFIDVVNFTEMIRLYFSPCIKQKNANKT